MLQGCLTKTGLDNPYYAQVKPPNTQKQACLPPLWPNANSFTEIAGMPDMKAEAPVFYTVAK